MYKIFVSRPSGEEFLVLISGIFDLEGSKNIGEHFRTAINKSPLPTEEEWTAIHQVGKDEDTIQPPPLSERKITVSVGISSVGSLKSLPKSDPVQVLRDRADKALYSAKAGGRNTVRHFDEILNRHGRVIEHQENVDVVIIDIGKEVNVQKGQEFIVYHPQFTGSVPYMFDDGRTRRALGICPRIPIGRIIAFEVEPEISFCQIEEKKCKGLFEPGSSLEAIPLGSISHLLTREDFLTGDEFQLTTSKEVASRCKEAENDDIPTMAAVFSLANEVTLFKDRGSAFINQCLANLYQKIQSQFSDDVFILKVKDTEFGVVWISDNVQEMETISESVITIANDSSRGLSDFRVGLYLGDKAFDIEGDMSNLSWEWAIDYAYFASARVRQIEKTKLLVFTPKVAHSLLNAYLESNQYGKVIGDYQELRKRGVNYYLIENKASLCCWNMPNGNTELLIESSDRAIELNEKSVVMWANSGFFYYHLEKINVAYERYRQIIEINKDYPFNKPYLVSAADTFLSAYQRGNCDLDIQYIQKIIERALSETLKEKRYSLYLKFKKVLDTLE